MVVAFRRNVQRFLDLEFKLRSYLIVCQEPKNTILILFLFTLLFFCHRNLPSKISKLFDVR